MFSPCCITKVNRVIRLYTGLEAIRETVGEYIRHGRMNLLARNQSNEVQMEWAKFGGITQPEFYDCIIH